MADQPASGLTPELLSGCALLLIPILLLGKCVFGGSDEPENKAEPPPKAVVEATTPAATAPAAAASTDASAAPVGMNMLEQAIFDAFPADTPKTKKARKRASDAADFVAYSINSSGYLCARVLDMQQAATGQYGISCRRARSEGGIANYLIDVRSGNVNEL